MAISAPTTAPARLLHLPSGQGKASVEQQQPQQAAPQGDETATAEASAPATTADETTAPARKAYRPPITMAQLRAELQNGPIGGSRSYRAKSNGDVVIINHPRSVLPKTGIESVDKISREITPTVDTTRSVASECFHAITKGLLYGALTGSVVGFMLKAIPFIPQRRFARLAWTTLAFSAIGAGYGMIMGGLVACIKGASKVLHSADATMKQLTAGKHKK